MEIKKAVIAAAGFGTRFLPATKTIPKELLHIIDRPIIQYLVEDAVESGIKEIAIVTRPGISLIKEHFLPNPKLETHLKKQGKKKILNRLKKIEKMAKLHFLSQDPSLPYGTGAPLVTASHLIKKRESFVYMFGDDIYLTKGPAAKQVLNQWEKNKKAVVMLVQEMPREEVSLYGIVKLRKSRVMGFVEKPKPEEAPSRLASTGLFVLNREIIDWLIAQKDKKRGKREFYLTDAIAWYAQKGIVLAPKIKGKWLTTGDPLRYLKATVELALIRKDIGQEFKDYLRKLDV